MYFGNGNRKIMDFSVFTLLQLMTVAQLSTQKLREEENLFYI